jgi:hypothetical protein
MVARAYMEGGPQRFIHRASGVRAHANYPVGEAVEAERLRGGMQSASGRSNPDTAYIDLHHLYITSTSPLHHLYITQRAMLRNDMQVGEENSA